MAQWREGERCMVKFVVIQQIVLFNLLTTICGCENEPDIIATLLWFLSITAIFSILGELDCPYQRTDNAYPRYLDTIVNNVKDEVACEVQCTYYEQFVCRSFAFYSSANQCFISGDDKGNFG